MKTCPLCDTAYPNHQTNCPTDGALLIESRELESGTVIRGKYRIVRLLGRGGMGTVYLAEHILLGRVRALKFISSELSQDPKFLKRFRHEAQAAIGLRHPNIVQVVDLDQAEDGSPYIAMEYVEGPDLRNALAGGGFPVERALSIARGVALGLGAAHSKGIIHRDVKPENILLAMGNDAVEIPKLLDFGIASMKESATAISRTRGLMLTPEYAAPEQWKGIAAEEQDGRLDLYALGGVLHEMLTGQTGFHSHNTEGWMYQHLQADPQAPSRLRPELVNWTGLDALVLQLLAKDREQRPRDAAEVVRILDKVRYGAPEVRRVTEIEEAAPGGSQDSAEAEHLESYSKPGQRANPASQSPESLSAIEQYLPTLQEIERPEPRVSEAPESAGPTRLALKLSQIKVIGSAIGLIAIILFVAAWLFWGAEVDLTTHPGGADVSIDGRPIGRTADPAGTLILPHIHHGQHTLTLSYPGYDTYSNTLTIGWFELRHPFEATLSITAPSVASNANKAVVGTHYINSSNLYSDANRQMVLNVAAIASVPLSANYSGEDWSILNKVFPAMDWKVSDGYREYPNTPPWPHALTAQAGEDIQVIAMGTAKYILQTEITRSFSGEVGPDALYFGKEFKPVLCDSDEGAMDYALYFSVAPAGKKPTYAKYEYSAGNAGGTESYTFGQDLKLPKVGDSAISGVWTTSCVLKDVANQQQ